MSNQQLTLFFPQLLHNLQRYQPQLILRQFAFATSNCYTISIDRSYPKGGYPSFLVPVHGNLRHNYSAPFDDP